MFNSVTLLGHLGKDPEVRSLNSGSKVCNVSLATSTRWKDKESGDYKEKTEWHRVVVYGDRLVDAIAEHSKKGSLVFVQGYLQTRSWTDNNQVTHYATEIVVSRQGTFRTLEKGEGRARRPQEAEGYEDQYKPADHGRTTSGKRGRVPEPDLDDEIPF